MKYLERFKRGDYVAIILDAFYRSFPKGVSENENSPITEQYNAIDSITERLGCSWINIHHSSKGSQSEKSVTDTGSGAGESRATDTHVVLREHQEPNCVVLDAALRSFPPIEPVVLRWNFPLWIPDDSLDAGKLKAKRTATDERQSERDNEGIVALAAVLAEGPATRSILRGRTALSPDRLQRLLDQLEASGSVTWTEQTIRGNACRIYQSVDLDDQNGKPQNPF